MLLSVSSSAQHAAAFSANPALSAHLRGNNFCIAMKENGFGPTAGTKAGVDAATLSRSTTELLELLAHTELFDSSSASDKSSSSSSSNLQVDASQLQSQQLTVSFPVVNNNRVHRERVVFDLNAPEQASFFAELMYVESLPRALRSSRLAALIADDTPDMLSITLTGLTGLIETHGRSSHQVVAAMHLVDVALPTLLTKLNLVYGGRAVSEVVLLGSHPSFTEAVDRRDLMATINRLLPAQDAKTYYPAMYVDSTSAAPALLEVCQVLKVELDNAGFNVYCPQSQPTVSPTVFFETQANAVPVVIAVASVFRYQIALWLCIILALWVFGAAYSLAFMSFKKDSLLYSTFNPNWEDRKRK